MPARAQWLLRVPVIIEEISALDLPVIDRATIERTFGVRRRRAVQLMAAFGGYQAGNTFLIDRQRLLERLSQIASGGEFQFEQRRRERFTDSLEAARRQRVAAAVSIPIPKAALIQTLDRLSTGIALAPGMLQIKFQEPIELLQKLFELSQAIANDFERFETTAGAQ